MRYCKKVLFCYLVGLVVWGIEWPAPGHTRAPAQRAWWLSVGCCPRGCGTHWWRCRRATHSPRRGWSRGRAGRARSAPRSRWSRPGWPIWGWSARSGRATRRRCWSWWTEMGNWVIGSGKLIEATTIANYIWWLASLRIGVIGNVVDSITEREKINYNYFLILDLDF